MARFVFRKSIQKLATRQVAVALFVVTFVSLWVGLVSLWGGQAAADDRRKGVEQRPSVIERLARRAKKAPLVVGHRGDSQKYPENTISAFQSAVRRGADLVEFDFRVSKDGVLYCMHDDTLDRTTNVEKALNRKDVKTNELPMDEIHDLDAGWWKSKRFKGTFVPTVEEALDTIMRGSTPMIEHKAGSAETLLQLLRKKRLVELVIVQSFDWEWLEKFHKLEPKVTIAALGPPDDDTKRITSDALERIKATGAKMVHWKSKELDREQVDRLHAAGYLVCVYTVDKDEALARCAAMDVDAITTNKPDHLGGLIRKKVVKRPEPAKAPSDDGLRPSSQ